MKKIFYILSILVCSFFFLNFTSVSELFVPKLFAVKLNARQNAENNLKIAIENEDHRALGKLERVFEKLKIKIPESILFDALAKASIGTSISFFNKITEMILDNNIKIPDWRFEQIFDLAVYCNRTNIVLVLQEMIKKDGIKISNESVVRAFNMAIYYENVNFLKEILSWNFDIDIKEFFNNLEIARLKENKVIFNLIIEMGKKKGYEKSINDYLQNHNVSLKRPFDATFNAKQCNKYCGDILEDKVIEKRINKDKNKFCGKYCDEVLKNKAYQQNNAYKQNFNQYGKVQSGKEILRSLLK